MILCDSINANRGNAKVIVEGLTMRKIEIGLNFYNNNETDKIYEKYKSFFEVEEDYGYSKKYTLIKEPTEELIKDIEAYFEVVREWNRKRRVFIEEVAEEAVEKLSVEEKAFIYDHPTHFENYTCNLIHFLEEGIHSREIDFLSEHPEDFLMNIHAKAVSLIIDNFDYSKHFYHGLYRTWSFGYKRRLYQRITGEYPDKLIEECVKELGDSISTKDVHQRLEEEIVNIERFNQLSNKYELSEKRYQQFKEYVDNHNKNHWQIIPYDIALLSCKNLEYELRQKLLNVLRVTIEEYSSLASDMPSFIFNQKDAVLCAVSESGKSLKRFKRFNSDDEIIRAALISNGEAIQYVNKELRYNDEYVKLALSSVYYCPLKLKCMTRYRDDKEMVKIALTVHGNHIKYASNRIQDDFDMAMFAIKHTAKSFVNEAVKYLSPRLRDNLEIALADIKEGYGHVREYSERLRDSDEVAKALLEKGWGLYDMSERIRNIYDKESNE